MTTAFVSSQDVLPLVGGAIIVFMSIRIVGALLLRRELTRQPRPAELGGSATSPPAALRAGRDGIADPVAAFSCQLDHVIEVGSWSVAAFPVKSARQPGLASLHQSGSPDERAA